MDRIESIRVFVAVARQRSFSKAAEELELSPQLVSKSVSKLEEHLGVRLLYRTTRKVSLTEAGQVYFEKSQQLLHDFDDMQQLVDGLHNEAKGQLRINAPVSFAARHLGTLLHEYQRQHPQVDVDLQLSDRKVDVVEEGFDISLRIGKLKDSSLVAKRLCPIRIVMCASPQYLAVHGIPKKPADMAKHRYLDYSYGEFDTRQPIYHWLSDSVQSQVKASRLVSNNGDVLVAAAIAGAGVIVQPTFIVGPAIKSGQLQVLLPNEQKMDLALYAVVSHRKLMTSKVRSFLEFIEGYFGETPYWDDFDSQHKT